MNNEGNEQIFKILKQNLGKEITCVYYDNGSILSETFRLDYVEEYNYIATKVKDKFDQKYWHIIYFIWYRQFIISITNGDGQVLYKNNNTIEDLINIKDSDDLIKKEKLVFGQNYIGINEQNSKEYLISKGFEQIDEDLKTDWVEFVECNYLKHIKATISMLEKINQGYSFYEAEIKVYRDEFDLSGYDNNFVDSAVRKFCKYPQEYSAYLIKAKTGTLFESKGKKRKKRKFSKGRQ